MNKDDNKEELGESIMIFNFSDTYEAPTSKINVKNGIIEWGKGNSYPQDLIEMYNYKGGSTHKAIINKKIRLIAGQGFEDIIDPDLASFAKKNNLDDEILKVVTDYELLNGFALEIIYDREGINITSLKHVPFANVRIGIPDEESEEEFYHYSADWTKYKKEGYKPESIRAYNKGNKGGRQLYYYTEYNPGNNDAYPIPTYSSTVNWIELDFEISQFHLNQVKNGYSPSMILNFATGTPNAEEQIEFAKGFKRKYAGTSNSGKIIISYSDGTEQAPTLIPIQLNDSDKRFVMLAELIETNVVRGSEIPPQLVLLTPGKLGSTEDRLELLKEFQMIYVSPRQSAIESCLNELFDTEEFRLKKYEI